MTGTSRCRRTRWRGRCASWVAGLEQLTGPDSEPFDRAKVFPYAFRHSYAQRLADAGASESELMDLMDHDSFDTTRGYFRIRAERRRRAAELCSVYGPTAARIQARWGARMLWTSSCT